MKKDLGTGYTIEGFDSVNPGSNFIWKMVQY